MTYTGLIAALGNPGSRYEETLHNCGFMFADCLLDLAKKEGDIEELSGKKFNALLWTFTLPQIEGKWLLAKPQTFMNDSGRAVAPILSWYKLSANELVVAQDELDLPPGTLRFKFGGGMAGHNGLLSITNCLGTLDYYRLRIGVGKPQNRDAMINWVLGRPKNESREKIRKAIKEAVKTFIIFCEDGQQAASAYARTVS